MNAMPQVGGISLDKRAKPNFVWNADLVTYDGPLVSLFKKENDDYLVVWVDCDAYRNRWLAVQVGRENLRGYLTQQISLLDVYGAARMMFLFETTKTAQKRNFRRVSLEALPKTYLPKPDSYLTPNIAAAGAVQLAQDLPTNYSIELDGELYLDDLATVPRLYQQLYSFHYGLQHLSRVAVRDALVNLLEKWRGGINAVNVFNGLRSVTPSIHRAQVKELKYASPGHIKLELLIKLASEISDACGRIEADEDFAAAEDLYGEVYSYFRSEKLAGFDRDGVKKSSAITSSQSRRLNSFVREYFSLMGWASYDESFAKLGLDPLAKIRLLLAYYRRLRKLRRYVVESKVALP